MFIGKVRTITRPVSKENECLTSNKCQHEAKPRNSEVRYTAL